MASGQICKTLPPLWQYSENYLSLDPTQPYWKTALKIASYATLIIPLIALAIRSYYRRKYPGQYFRHWTVQFKQDIAKRLVPYSSFEFILRKGIEVNEPEKKLDEALKDLKSFNEHHELAISIIYRALMDMTSGVNTDRARKIYKKSASFLYQNNYALNDKQNSPHILAMLKGFAFLFKYLRKQVKLHDKWSKIKEMAKDKVDNSIREKALEYLGLTWLHGTTAYTLDSARKFTNDEILSTGELRKRKVRQLGGEMTIGVTSCGINQRSLSGVNLINANFAKEYAKNNKFTTELEMGSYNSLLKTKSFDNLLDFSNFFANQVEAVRRVNYVDPERVACDKATLKDAVSHIFAKIKADYFDTNDTKIFEDTKYSLSLFDLLVGLEELEDLLDAPNSFPLFDLDAHGLAQIPVVLGSRTVYGSPISLYSKNAASPEETYPGALKMGRDLQVVFTDKHHLNEVSKLLSPNVKVEEMAVLEAAHKLDKSLSSYLYS